METERYLVRQKGGVLCCFWDILGILVESYFCKCFKKKLMIVALPPWNKGAQEGFDAL